MRLTGTTAIFDWFSKKGKNSFQKDKKERENGTFGSQARKIIFSLHFTTIKQLFRCTITIYLTNYYLPTSQMVIHCWRVT